jgi:hypothetical protein
MPTSPDGWFPNFPSEGRLAFYNRNWRIPKMAKLDKVQSSKWTAQDPYGAHHAIAFLHFELCTLHFELSF